jgi:hypothetical protein
MLGLTLPEVYDPAVHRMVKAQPAFLHAIHTKLPATKDRIFAYCGASGCWCVAAWEASRNGARRLSTILALPPGDRPPFGRDDMALVEAWWRSSVRGSTAARMHDHAVLHNRQRESEEVAGLADEQLSLKNHLYNRLQKRTATLGGAWNDVREYRRRLFGRGKRIYTMR